MAILTPIAARTSRRAFLGGALAVAAASALPSATAAETTSSTTAGQATVTDLVLCIGADESQRTLVWYTDVEGADQVRWGQASQVASGRWAAKGSTVTAVSGLSTDSVRYYHHATLTDLRTGTEYAYQVGSDAAGWSDTRTFRTASAGRFQAILVGDPQIGASRDNAADGEGWRRAMDVASSWAPRAAYLLSLGDQVNTAGNEQQYTEFLSYEQVGSLPIATTIGNHDVASLAHEQHFAVPNLDRTAGAPKTSTQSGGDYYSLFNGVLTINLNTNSLDTESHAAFLRRVVAAEADARWRIVVIHKSFYTVASHAVDSDVLYLREQLTPVLSELDIDLVLAGHDHHYVRTYLMEGPRIASDDAGSTLVKEPGQALHITLNSASGSKFYAAKGTFDYAAVTSQTSQAQVTVLDARPNSLTLTTRLVEDGSLVDEVTLRK